MKNSDRIIDLIESVHFWIGVVLVGLSVYGCFHLLGLYDAMFRPASELPFYEAKPPHRDDTLRIAIVGDSWAEFHSKLHGSVDTLFPRQATMLTDVPVKCRIR